MVQLPDLLRRVGRTGLFQSFSGDFGLAAVINGEDVCRPRCSSGDRPKTLIILRHLASGPAGYSGQHGAALGRDVAKE